jgi:hypothetical protein
MHRPRRTVNENVVKENENKPLEEGLEYFVHQSLESRRRIREPEWHDQELKETFMNPKRRLVHIIRVHTHLVVT